MSELRCSVCGEPVTRIERVFVHTDDTVTMRNGRLVSYSDYSHAAQVEVIDVVWRESL